MGKEDKYLRNVTEVNKIINMLSEEERNKLPRKLINFCNENSDKKLEDEIIIDFDNLSIETKKLLKVVDYYLRDKKIN